MKPLIFLLSILFIPFLSIAQDNSINEWKMVLDREQISSEEVAQIAPNFPSISSFDNSLKLNAKVADWRKKHSNEWNSLDSRLGLSQQYSLVYLGVYSAKEYKALLDNKFTHGWLEWIDAAEITDRRLNEIAPHLPTVPEGATAEYKDEFERQFEKWRILYGHEYEALVNAPEIVAINEHYTGYVTTMGIPKYVRALQTDEFPTKQTSEDPNFDELLFELDKQTWYFIYEPNVFKREFGFEPVLPEDFDAESFRTQVKERLEINKRIEAGEIQPINDNQ